MVFQSSQLIIFCHHEKFVYSIFFDNLYSNIVLCLNIYQDMIPELFTQKLTNTKKAKVRKYVYFVTHGNEGLAIRHGRMSEPAEDQDPPPIIPGDFSEGAVARCCDPLISCRRLTPQPLFRCEPIHLSCTTERVATASLSLLHRRRCKPKTT